MQNISDFVMDFGLGFFWEGWGFSVCEGVLKLAGEGGWFASLYLGMGCLLLT